MEKVDRRSFIRGTLASIAGCTCCGVGRARAKPARRGCTMSGAAEEDGYYWSRRLMSSGDARLDQICASMASALDQVFGLRPGFCFYDDSEGHNAVADPVARFADRQDGTVLFGVGLLKLETTPRKPGSDRRSARRPSNEEPSLLAGLYKEPESQIAAMMVMAHEWAHICQYKCDVHSPYINGWRMEPHADYLAGWALARVHALFKPGTLPPGVDSGDLDKEGLMSPTGFHRISASIFDGKGNSDFTSPDHHGQEEYRLGMLRVGYHDKALTLEKAFARGIEITELHATCRVR